MSDEMTPKNEALEQTSLASSTGSANPLKSEFYDQRRWREIHRYADDLIATKDGKILAALYRSPDERVREDQVAFAEMLREWAATLDSPNVPLSHSGPSAGTVKHNEEA